MNGRYFFRRLDILFRRCLIGLWLCTKNTKVAEKLGKGSGDSCAPKTLLLGVSLLYVIALPLCFHEDGGSMPPTPRNAGILLHHYLVSQARSLGHESSLS